MACDQSYFRRPQQKTGARPGTVVRLAVSCSEQKTRVPHGKQNSVINLGSFRPRPAEKNKIHILYSPQGQLILCTLSNSRRFSTDWRTSSFLASKNIFS